MNETPAAWRLERPGLSIHERHDPTCILRVRKPDEALLAALGHAFDVAWPVRPNTTACSRASILWMAPGQWAIVDVPAASAIERATRACGESLHHLADVSDGYVGFEVAGRFCRELLAKGCSLDLHPRVFHPGACAQTLLAHTGVLLHAPRAAAQDGQLFRLHADASLAEHLRRWFQDAALEFT